MILLEKSYWEIRKTKSMGRGVFATKEIPPGTIIGDYLGEVVDPSEDTSDEFGMYNLWINFETMVYADPNTEGLHLLNHSCAPNISMFPYKGHMLFFSLRKIFPR
jgi:SET domain-containing protein